MITHSKVGFCFLNIFFRITIHPHAHKSYHLSWSGDEVVPSVASIPILFPSGWWLTYPYEKSWSSSVGIFWHSQYDGKVIQNSMVPNHQPVYIYYPIYYPNGNTQQWLGYPISFHPPRTLPRATPRPSAAWETFLPAGGVPEWDSSNGTITMTTWQYGYESKPNGTLRHSWCSWMVMNNSPTKLW